MLIDAFQFFNEKELVELRIKYLNEIVDYFVVVEADTTHQGKKKDWNFPNILKNELKESQEKLGWKTERSEKQIDEFIKRCE